MKVVIFCGGMGMRLRDYSDKIPKPLVDVGARPILWHLMKYYAHYGHKDFILCLGHGGTVIKDFFLNYNECTTNNFILSHGGKQLELLGRDIDDWRITFVDTGLKSNVGERLRRVKPFLESEEMFLANYADGLSDLNLDDYVQEFAEKRKVAQFISIPAPHTFHLVRADEHNHVTALQLVAKSEVRINGGFFVFRQEIFDYMNEGEELVVEPFQRLSDERELLAVPYDGFWRNMDTFKDKIELDAMVTKDDVPWKVWSD